MVPSGEGCNQMTPPGEDSYWRAGSRRRSRLMETVPNTPPSDDKTNYDCIVISDLHLGSDVCQAKLLEEFLIWAAEHCRELVINGDIFDDLNFKRLTKRHF